MAGVNLKEFLKISKGLEERFKKTKIRDDEELPEHALNLLAMLPHREQEAFCILQTINYQLTNALNVGGVIGGGKYDVQKFLQSKAVMAVIIKLETVKNKYHPPEELWDDHRFDVEFAIVSQIDNIIKRLAFAMDVADMENCNELEEVCHRLQHHYPDEFKEMLAQLVFDIIVALRKLVHVIGFGDNFQKLSNEMFHGFLAGAYHDINSSQRMSLTTGA